MSDSNYFASKPASEVASDLEGRLETWTNVLEGNGLIEKWKKSYRMYYGRHFQGHGNDSEGEILRTGDDGELAAFAVNHYRNLIKHILVLTTNQRPAFDARAVNSDSKSLQQAKLANNILEAYLREKRLGRYLKNAAEQALIFGKSFIKVTWDTSLGKPYAANTTQDEEGNTKTHVQYEGDIDLQCLDPLSVYCDPSSEDWSRIEWVVLKTYRNKFNLAAKYPHLKDEIENLPSKEVNDGMNFMNMTDVDLSSDVPVFELFHKRTPAMPNGRYMIFCNGNTVLYDGAIPYDRLPIFRITPGEVHGTTEGYTDAFDLMAMQEAYNVLISSVFTNEQAFGVQQILVPEGSNLSADQIGRGLSVLKYNPMNGQKPEALQLTATPAEVFNTLTLLERLMETISGVNSVSRGNPESQMGKDASGTALALVQSMAVQFASGFQESWAELLEDCGSFMLALIRDFCQTTRMVALAGKHNKGAMAEFKGSDLANIDRVVVELGNPLSKTTAGRVQMADNLLSKGMVKTPQEYLNVLNTGNLDPLTEGPEAETALIRKENEMMMDGKKVTALVGDSHLLHIQEHRVVINNPELRIQAAMNDPASMAIVKGALDHIQEHMNIYKSQDPLWSMVSGEPPAPQPAPPQGPPPGPPMLPPPPPGAHGMPPHHGKPHPGPSVPAMMQPGAPQGPIPGIPQPARPPLIQGPPQQ